MYKICVFGGTTEGRELVEFLNAQPCEVTACVATEYGQALLPEAERLTVSARRLPADEKYSFGRLSCGMLSFERLFKRHTVLIAAVQAHQGIMERAFMGAEHRARDIGNHRQKICHER